MDNISVIAMGNGESVLLYRSALTLEEEKDLMDSFTEKYTNVPKEGSCYSPILQYNWPVGFPGFQDTKLGVDDEVLISKLNRLAQKLLRKLLLELGSKHRVLSEFCPDTIRAIGYKEDTILPIHTDMFMGWVLSLSLGESIKFFIQNGWNDPSQKVIQLNSTDVIFFNGQSLPHGILKTPNNESHSTQTFRRINIQFRDPKCMCLFKL